MTKTLAVLVTCLVVLLVACQPKGIKIGAFLSLTGATSAYGVSAANAINMAKDEANAAGGINARRIELEIEDDQSKTNDVPRIVEHLIKEHEEIGRASCRERV